MNNFVLMNFGWKIVYALTLCLLLCAGCNRNKILRKNDVAQIMYEIFVADQYAKTYSEVNLAADSILLYKHIFDKHDCTLEDYQRSIRHYIQDEKAYVYILKRATDIARREAKKANSELSLEKHSLYYMIPYILPANYSQIDEWWKRKLDRRYIEEPGKFFRELQKISVNGAASSDKRKHTSELQHVSKQIIIENPEN